MTKDLSPVPTTVWKVLRVRSRVLLLTGPGFMIITVPTTWDQTTTIPTSKQKVHTDINNLKKNVSVGNGKRFYLSSIECLYGCFVVLKKLLLQLHLLLFFLP